jgi:hypothetical protein
MEQKTPDEYRRRAQQLLSQTDPEPDPDNIPDPPPADPAADEPDSSADNAPAAAAVPPLEVPPGIPSQLVPHRYQDTLDDLASALGDHAGAGQALVNDWAASAVELGAHRPVVRDGAERLLKARWGSDYANRMANVGKAIQALGGYDGEFAKWLDRTGRGDDPATILALESYGSGRIGGRLSKADAKREHARIMKDRSHAYWRGDRDAVAHARRLADIVFG